MKTKLKIFFSILILLGVLALLALFVSTHNVPVMEPKGMIGLKEKEIIITAALLMLIVVLPVYALTIWFCVRYRAGQKKSKHTPDWEHNSIAECCWWGVPFIIIVILAVITWRSSHELNPYTPIDGGQKPLTVQVVALDWKWLFIYPEQGIATVNFVQFPEKTPISFEITADAPMNSFWIPQLGGQIYAMPAMRTRLHLIADEMGSYRGSSSNISGKGFAGMVFTAKSSSQKEFDEWVESVKQSSDHLTLEEYNQLAEPSEYNPVASYVLMQEDLFDQIIMKYTAPLQQDKSLMK